MCLFPGYSRDLIYNHISSTSLLDLVHHTIFIRDYVPSRRTLAEWKSLFFGPESNWWSLIYEKLPEIREGNIIKTLFFIYIFTKKISLPFDNTLPEYGGFSRLDPAHRQLAKHLLPLGGHLQHSKVTHFAPTFAFLGRFIGYFFDFLLNLSFADPSTFLAAVSWAKIRRSSVHRLLPFPTH